MNVVIKNINDELIDDMNLFSEDKSDLIMVGAFIGEVTDGCNAINVIDALDSTGSYNQETVGGSISFSLTDSYSN